MLFLSLNNGETLVINGDAKTDLFKLLLKKTRALGHKVSFEEIKQDPEMVDPNQYNFYFESLDHAAQLAWELVQEENAKDKKDEDDDNEEWGPSINYNRERAKEIKAKEARERELNIARQKIQNHSMPKPTKAESGKSKKTQRSGRLSSITKAEAKDAIKNFYQIHGRIPTASECNNAENRLPSYQVLYRYFGTKENWLQMVLESKCHITKEYHIIPGEPLDIHLDTARFKLSITSTDEIVKINFTEK